MNNIDLINSISISQLFVLFFKASIACLILVFVLSLPLGMGYLLLIKGMPIILFILLLIPVSLILALIFLKTGGK
jgi:hypothetical protein